MGADGGTIPKRCELVKEKKKKEKVTKDMANVTKWRICQLTQQPLKQPIVACPLGRLFNKDTLIEALITKSIADSENAKHIRSLKDVRELVLSPNPATEASSSNGNGTADKGGDTYKDYNVSPYICPVVGLEMNGNHRFVVNWNCGCVLSEKAVKEVKASTCHKCGKKYDVATDLVVLNGTEEEMAHYRNRLGEKRALERLEKKAKKCKGGNSGHSAASTAATTKGQSVVFEDKHDAAIKRKAETTSASKAAKQSKSIQDDPNSTAVFKSLFTTSDGAKQQPSSHWVTHNPLYY